MDTVTGYTDPREFYDFELLSGRLWGLPEKMKAEMLFDHKMDYTEWPSAFFDLLVADLGMEQARDHLVKHTKDVIRRVKRMRGTDGEECSDRDVDLGLEWLKNSFTELIELRHRHILRVPPFVPRGFDPFEKTGVLKRKNYRELRKKTLEKIHPLGSMTDAFLTDYDGMKETRWLLNESARSGNVYHYSVNPWKNEFTVNTRLTKKMALIKVPVASITIERNRPFVMVCPACGKVINEKTGTCGKVPCGKEAVPRLVIHGIVGGSFGIKKPKYREFLMNCFITGKKAEQVLGVTAVEVARRYNKWLEEDAVYRYGFYDWFRQFTRYIEHCDFFGQLYRVDYYGYLMVVHEITKTVYLRGLLSLHDSL